MEENARREALLPPVTNRGVNKTRIANAVGSQKNYDFLSVMIDWCQLTVKEMQPRDIAEELLKIPYWLMKNHFRSSGNGKNHKAYMCFDDIRVYEFLWQNQEKGYQIIMGGKGCRNYEKFLEANNETWYDFFARALKYKINFPRIDVAIDDRKTYFQISELSKLAKEGLAVTKSRFGSMREGFKINEQKRLGNTLYIGSRSSEFHMCFYEKGYEQAEKYGCEIDKKWNRYELRFRQKRAVELAKALVEWKDISKVSLEILNGSIRFVKKPENSQDKKVSRYPLWEPWEIFMHDVGKLKLKIKPEKKDYYTRLAWLRKSVMPTLKIYLEIDEILGLHTIKKLLEETKLNEEHFRIIEDCIKQLQAEERVFKEKEGVSCDGLELFDEGFIDYNEAQIPFD